MMKSCQKAAMNAYENLRAQGVTDPSAFAAAVSVYQYHHPEVPTLDAINMVAMWIDDRLSASLPQ